jgi:hypothetical protein
MRVKDISSTARTGEETNFSVRDVIVLQASRQQCQVEGANVSVVQQE